jgi:hypothetical protein
MGRQTIQATKERVVERVRTVIEGQGGCRGGGDAFSSTATVLCEIKKVTASERSASQIYR